MSKVSGMTRGDRKRNARRARLRGVLPRDGAVIGIDLADVKQAIAVIDHDVRVDWLPLAPRTARAIDLAIGEPCQCPIFPAPDGRRLGRPGAGGIAGGGQARLAGRALCQAPALRSMTAGTRP
jgi:hypothetical protein